MKKSILAIKAINEYRKINIISYLGLRYYLANASACKDRWISEISCKLSKDENSKPAYLKTYHFKENKEDGTFKYREFYLPTPNEALAETALLYELSMKKEFKPEPYIYSYLLADKSEPVGIFSPYFNGYQKRHNDITKACKIIKDGIVLYTDIQKFYPKVCANNAKQVWSEYSQLASLPTDLTQLGEKLLDNHTRTSENDKTGKCLLTGPIFSHIIANILLNKIDIEMYELTEGNYWRYVDDIVLVGTLEQVEEWRRRLSELLKDMNLELHTGDKDFKVKTTEWLEGESDFDNSLSSPWASLVADTKRYLVANPKKLNEVKNIFGQNNIRLPIIDYSQLINEASYIKKFSNWLGKYKWSLKAVKKIDTQYLLELANKCRSNYLNKFTETLQEIENFIEQSDESDESDESDAKYKRKRVLPTVRYLAGRLAYFLSENELLEVSQRLERFLHELPELYLITHVLRAVATRDLTNIVRMGINATQAAAQLLKISNEPIKFNWEILNQIDANSDEYSVVEQSLAILTFNGIKYDCDLETSELRQLANAHNMQTLMSSSDKFIQQIACLHGVLPSRHAETLSSAFDYDESLTLDLLNQLKQSS